MFSDVLRGQTSGRLRVHGHRVPDGREEQLRDARAVGRGEIERLPRVGGAREPDQLLSRLVDGQGQSRRAGQHGQGDARFAGRDVRARGEPGMGIRRPHGQGFERDEHRALRGHRQAVDHQESGQGHEGECA